MNSETPFYKYIDLFLAYPKTKNMNKEDFIAPTCFYKCEENNNKVECDMKECIEFVNKRDFPNKKTEIFTKKFVSQLSDSSRYLTANFDGFHIQYTPDGQEKAYNLVNIIRSDSQRNTRTGVIELNSLRLNLIKELN